MGKGIGGPTSQGGTWTSSLNQMLVQELENGAASRPIWALPPKLFEAFTATPFRVRASRPHHKERSYWQKLLSKYLGALEHLSLMDEKGDPFAQPGGPQPLGAWLWALVPKARQQKRRTAWSSKRRRMQRRRMRSGKESSRVPVTFVFRRSEELPI